MIPKKIHYCWFGRAEKPKSVQKCIASWEKYCPNYEITEWNEDNFDIDYNPYTKMCYEQKKFAFLSDFVRLLVIEENGGIYLDTDVELIKPLDDLLNNEAYIGFETDEYVNTGMGFGSVAHGAMVREMIAQYDELSDGTHATVSCPILNTQAMDKLGMQRNGKMQHLSQATVYPAEWFNPYNSVTGVLKKTDNTVSIHWYSKSWMSKATVIRCKLLRPLHRFQCVVKRKEL